MRRRCFYRIINRFIWVAWKYVIIESQVNLSQFWISQRSTSCRWSSSQIARFLLYPVSISQRIEKIRHLVRLCYLWLYLQCFVLGCFQNFSRSLRRALQPVLKGFQGKSTNKNAYQMRLPFRH